MKTIFEHTMSKTVYGRMNFVLSTKLETDSVYAVITDRKTTKMVGTINQVRPLFEDGTRFLLVLNVADKANKVKSWRFQTMEQVDNFLLKYGKFTDWEFAGIQYRVLKEIPENPIC